MKRFLVCSFLLSLIAVAPATLAQSTDAVDAEATSAETPANALVERGDYLVNRAVMCAECHSQRNGAGEIIKSTRLHGGPVPVIMPTGWAKPWAYKAPRIAGLPQHTDEEFVTLMTTGVNRDGKELMLPMPPFRMSEEDALAIAAYLRTLP